jgi:C-terminal peptidase prc
MKNILRLMSKLFVIATLLVGIQASAETPAQHDDRLLQKAIGLIVVACEIYPAINDLDACVDNVVRKFLADLDVAPEHITKIIRDQAAGYSAKYPPNNLPDKFLTKRALRDRMLVNKLVDIIRAGCAIPPAITDFNLCMDKVYHSILSSRDPHSRYLNPEEAQEYERHYSGELQGIGASIMYTTDKKVGVVEVMKGSPAERAGVKDGDRIIAILEGAERQLSSPFANLDEPLKRIRGKPDTPVTLVILRGESDQLLTITVVRGLIITPMVTSEILVAPNQDGAKYGYVHLTQFGKDLRKKMVDAIVEVQKANPDIKGIIIDLRGNPGGLLNEAYEAIDALTDSPEVFVSIRNNEGIQSLTTSPDYAIPTAIPGVITLLPIGVLIDGYSASAAEILAGSLKKQGRSVTIGKGTWRKGTVQAQIPQNDGSLVKMTISEYLIGSPTNWIAVQCVGVNPDIEYEAKGTIKPKKEIHECDIEGAVASGGKSSDPNAVPVPLFDRDPARYMIGLDMRDAVEVFDNKKLDKYERIKKLLKMEDQPPTE